VSVSGRAKTNVAVLFLAQAVIGSQAPMHIVLGGLAGASLAANAALATLPISVVVLVTMFSAPLMSLAMGRFGRRFGFLLGTGAGMLGALVVVRSLYAQSFWLLVLGSMLFGIMQSAQAFYRFAAADEVPDAVKPKAISLVLAGGLISALLGPELVQRFGDALAPTQFAGAYVAILGLNIAGAVILLFLRMPTPVRHRDAAASGRPLGVILRDPRVVAAILCAMLAYAVMSLVMTSTPLGMVAHGHTPDHAADVVRWHVFAMFAPSFFTGFVIARVGHLPVIATGMALLALCSSIALAGVELHRFYLALIALGVGWNFGFIGATSLLATTHTVEERGKVQGLNDFLVFGLVTVASFASGALLNIFGWNAVQVVAIPCVVVGAAVVAWLAIAHWSRRRAGVQHPI
jgi:predicted MFS family arabinose efflux permease